MLSRPQGQPFLFGTQLGLPFWGGGQVGISIVSKCPYFLGTIHPYQLGNSLNTTTQQQHTTGSKFDSTLESYYSYVEADFLKQAKTREHSTCTLDHGSLLQPRLPVATGCDTHLIQRSCTLLSDASSISFIFHVAISHYQRHRVDIIVAVSGMKIDCVSSPPLLSYHSRVVLTKQIRPFVFHMTIYEVEE